MLIECWNCGDFFEHREVFCPRCESESFDSEQEDKPVDDDESEIDKSYYQLP
mgnify:CR=1 FL=1